MACLHYFGSLCCCFPFDWLRYEIDAVDRPPLLQRLVDCVPLCDWTAPEGFGESNSYFVSLNYFKELTIKLQADEVVVGIYDCDWYTAPLPFRILVLNVLTRGSRSTIFRASPFYDLDLPLLTNVSWYLILFQQL